MLFFGTIFQNYFFDTVYATFGWWFVMPGLPPTYGGILNYGNWAMGPEEDYLTNWFLTQYCLFFYYSWVAATFFQALICRKPTYEQLIFRGIRFHNSSVSFFFLFVIHFYDFFFLMRSGMDFLFAFQPDIFYLKLFLAAQVLDMNFFMYASALIIWQDHLDKTKLFGTYEVRNTRARNRQLREAVILNTFISIVFIITAVYCISPEIWDDEGDDVTLDILFIYRKPYIEDQYFLSIRKHYPISRVYGNMSDYTPNWYRPNATRSSKFFPTPRVYTYRGQKYRKW